MRKSFCLAGDEAEEKTDGILLFFGATDCKKEQFDEGGGGYLEFFRREKSKKV